MGTFTKALVVGAGMLLAAPSVGADPTPAQAKSSTEKRAKPRKKGSHDVAVVASLLWFPFLSFGAPDEISPPPPKAKPGAKKVRATRGSARAPR